MSVKRNPIEQLLQAEEQANQIIKQSKQYKEARFKDAMISVQNELNGLKKQYNQKFNEYTKNYNEQSNQVKDKAQNQKEIAEIKQQYEQNNEKVAKYICNSILTVDLSLPEVQKGNY